MHIKLALVLWAVVYKLPIGRGMAAKRKKRKKNRRPLASKRALKNKKRIRGKPGTPRAKRYRLHRTRKAVSTYGEHLTWFCLFAFGALTLLVYWLAPARPSDPQDLCAIFKQHPDWFDAARESHTRYPIPIPVIMSMMYQESSYYHEAKPGYEYIFGVIPYKRISTAHGYSQALDGTWSEYLRDSGRKDAVRIKFDDAYDFMGWYLYNAAKTLNLRLDNAYGLYLAYHDGIGGYQKKTYKSKAFLLNAAQKVKTRAIRYQSQLSECYAELKKPNSIRQFFKKLTSGL